MRFHISFRISLSISPARILIRIVVHLEINLGRIDIMTTLSLPTHIHHIPPHLFRSLILSVVFYSFQYRVLAYLLLNLFLNIRAILDCNTTFVPEISYWPLHNLGWHSPPWGRQTQLLELLLTAAELAWGWGWAQQVLPDPSLPLPPSNHLCHCLSFYSSCYCHQREHHKGNLVA